jgi:hypothetical protein
MPFRTSGSGPNCCPNSFGMPEPERGVAESAPEVSGAAGRHPSPSVITTFSRPACSTAGAMKSERNPGWIL